MRYNDGLLERMNGMPYAAIQSALLRAGGPGLFYDGCDANLLGL